MTKQRRGRQEITAAFSLIAITILGILIIAGCNVGDRPVIEPAVSVRGSVGTTAQYSLHFDDTDIITTHPMSPGHMVYYYEFTYPTVDPDSIHPQKGYTSFTHVIFQKTWDFSEGTSMYSSDGTKDLWSQYKVTFFWCESGNIKDAETITEVYEEYPHGPLIYLGSVKGGAHIRMNTPYVDDGSITRTTNADGDDEISWTDSFPTGEVIIDNTPGYDSTWTYERNSHRMGTRIRIDDGDWQNVEDNGSPYVWPTTIADGDHTVDIQQQDEGGFWGAIIQDEFTKP